MAFVITQPCIGEARAECFAVCPADCIHFIVAMPAAYPGEGQQMAVIDPDECIDCGACLPACPVQAIVEDGVDEYWAQINRQLAPAYAGQRPPATP